MRAPAATSARETFKALYAHVRPHRWVVTLGLLCALVGAAGGLLQPLATKTLVAFLAAIVVMAILDAVLLGVALGVIVLVGGLVALAMPRIARDTERSQEAVGEISTALEQEGAAAIWRITQVQHLATEPPHRPVPPRHPAAGPAPVRFADVSFRYRPGLPDIRRQVSFKVPAGGMTAIVGPSGAGKSTVFALVERFYDTTGGRVLFDGKDVRDWSLPHLRSQIGYVEQDAPVLAGTLRENLTFAAPGAADNDIRDVLSRTKLATLVDRLPHGLDTPVGHRGSTLSGGERQRVAIARALLRKPRLLLLDEVTSQLDAVNELALRDVIAETATLTPPRN